MVNGVLLRKLFRDLLARRWSFVALAAIVGVGVGVFMSMSAVYRDLEGARKRYYETHHLADFSVNLKRAPEATLDGIEHLPNIRVVRGRVRVQTLVYLEANHRPIPGLALSVPAGRRPVIDDVLLTSLALLSAPDAREVILDTQFADAHDLVPGDRVRVLLLDKQHDLLVVGTAMSPEFVYLIPPGGGLAPDPAGYGVMYLPRKFLQESTDLEGAYNELVGLAFDTSEVALKDTLELIKERLDPYGVTNAVQARDQASVSVLRDELTNLKATATIFPLIFLGVAAMVLNIMVGRLVAQQRSVIGTLRAIGHSHWAVTRHYIGYGVSIGIAGGLTGILLGIWLQDALVGIYRDFFAMPDIRTHWYPYILVAGLGIAVLFGAVGTLRSSRRAAALEPAEAMRPPPPEKGGRVLIEGISFIWSRFSFQTKMVFRSVFRNPFRSSVSIIAAMIATALLVATLCLYDGLYYMMEHHFQRIAHEDVTLTTREPIGVRSIHEASMLPSVSEAEPHLSVVSDLRHGAGEKRTSLTGLPERHPLYTPLDSNGNPIVIPEKGLVLTRQLSKMLDVHVGDRIRVRPLIAERREVSAPVVRIIESFLGISAYCDIEYLSGLLGEDYALNQLLLKTFGGDTGVSFMSRIAQRPRIIGIADRTRSLDQMKETMGKFMGSFLAVAIIFSGIIAFGSVINTALVSLSERERDVGTLRVLGYTAGQVSRIFSGESFLLNAVGIGSGLALGVWLTYLLSKAYETELYRLPVVIYPSRLLICAAIMLVCVALAQIIVFRMIRALRWLDVLKIKE